MVWPIIRVRNAWSRIVAARRRSKSIAHGSHARSRDGPGERLGARFYFEKASTRLANDVETALEYGQAPRRQERTDCEMSPAFPQMRWAGFVWLAVWAP